MFGPLYLRIAKLASLLNNICISWYLLTLTQMTLVKVLMIFKWSFMTGIDDNFVGEFLILVNVGFLSLSQLTGSEVCMNLRSSTCYQVKCLWQ